MGQASIATGVLIVVLDWVLGEKVGIWTICNMLFIGIFMDLLMLNNLVPTFHNVIARIIMMLLGMFIIGTGSANGNLATYLLEYNFFQKSKVNFICYNIKKKY